MKRPFVSSCWEDENVGVVFTAISSGRGVCPQKLEGKCTELSILVWNWEQLIFLNGTVKTL